MSKLIDRYFERFRELEYPILIDIAGDRRREVAGTELVPILDRLASLLGQMGIHPGDRVVAVVDNTLQAALLLLAAMRHGITLCMQPADASPAEVEKAARLVGAKFTVNATGKTVCNTESWCLDDLPAVEKVPADVRPGTPLTVTFTSGSTGAPKGIVHAAESFLACADAFNRQTSITNIDRFLNVMPMYYMAGIFNGILAPLQAGAAVVIDSAFSTGTALKFWRVVAENEVSALWLSPTMLSLATKLDRGDKQLPKAFRRLFVGTGAMLKSDAETFEATYGLAPLQSYGLSELLYVSVDDAESPCFGTVGCPLEGVEIATGDSGTLVITTPYAFLGYLEDGSVRTPQQPFVTSDIASYDDNRLSILGRSDDVILRGGVNVNPFEAEAYLAPLFGQRSFCLIGLADAILGQKVILVLEEGQRPQGADILIKAQRLMREKGGRVQIDGVAYVATFPIGPTGKIRRKDLREMLAGETI
ncbi:long-chain acyl-CoA synthetase [Rhizobium sp. BK212]|uniref:class I adenylate-forming enzyme family protein n=1 Tax=unclassified Rhizobium TaxID=2613769 RepID=UPI00160B249F|nr:MULTISPECIES: fatty acid--CoA ligase family protein [unclassified Rhizobium]MBB4217461.1 long-chain acyl-CoA synthetase [Rhizobium sp. BK212]MBB4255262.1 long-chain acyl-CoA synthetase [Rhizobium sp. BK008]